MAAALRLQQLGVRAAVLEAREGLASRPNVVDLSGDALDVVRSLGAESLLAGRTSRSGRGEDSATIALRALENGLRHLASERGVPIHHGARVTGIEQGADAARVLLADASTTGVPTSARWVLNATGGRAGFEDALGMGLHFQGDWNWFGAVRVPHIPSLPSGERVSGLVGMVRHDRPDRFGELRPAYDELPIPADAIPHRGASWYGWQNEIDGMSMFTPLASHQIERLGLEAIAERVVSPARAHGERRLLDTPRLLRAESATVEAAAAGRVLAVGDAAGRAHPKHMRGTQLALEDGWRAAQHVAQALREPRRATAISSAYDDATRAAHARWGHDGSRTVSVDPVDPAHTRDVVELPLPRA